MTENEIRNRTASILEAYISLTGEGYVPGIPEFLLLRRTAIEEISKSREGAERGRPEGAVNRHFSEGKGSDTAIKRTRGAGEAAGQEIKTEGGNLASGENGSSFNGSQAAGAKREQADDAAGPAPCSPFREGRPAKPPAYPERSAGTAGRKNLSPQTPAPSTQGHVQAAGEKQMSDYEILRGLKDPWN